MRTLNRPMFNMGGPIKEGVMHGIREPYAGGQLVRPGPGRPGYQGETFWQKLAAQYSPKNFASPKKFIQRINPFKKLKTVQKLAPTVKKGVQDLRGIFTQTGKTPGITGTTSGSAWAAGPSKYLGHLKKLGPISKNLWGKHRWKTALGAPIAAPYVIDMAKKIPWKGVGDVIKAPYEKWKDVLGIEDKIEDKDGTDTITDKIITETGVPGGGDPGAKGTGEWFAAREAEAATKLAKEQQNERLKSYLDMMGYDSAKKNAMSDG